MSAAPQRSIALLVGAILAAVVLLGSAASYVQLQTTREAARALDYSREFLLDLERLLSSAKDLESSQRGYLVSGSAAYLARYREARKEIAVLLPRLRRLVQDDPLRRAELATLEQRLAERIAELERVIGVYDTSGFAAARSILATDPGSRSTRLVRQEVDRMRALEQQRLDALQVASVRESTLALWAPFATGLAAILTLALGVAAIRRTEQRLRTADLRKDRFLAMLSHELRTPLAPIRTAAEILANPSITQHQLQWVRQVIERQVKNMAGLLDDLLDVARITQGKLDLKKESVSLERVVESAVEAVRPLLERKQHRFSASLPKPEPALEADPLRLAQILSNLLMNAAKYTDPGGEIELAATVDAGRQQLELSVRDNGIGIAPEALEDVFAMFAQVPEARPRSDGGLGIGLALVKGLVELHGGSISARSPGPGHGTTITLRLPLAVAMTTTPTTPVRADAPAALDSTG